MTMPLVVLAACSVLLGFIGTPAWPCVPCFLERRALGVDFGRCSENTALSAVMLLSTSMVFLGLRPGMVVVRPQADRERGCAGRAGYNSTADVSRLSRTNTT